MGIGSKFGGFGRAGAEKLRLLGKLVGKFGVLSQSVVGSQAVRGLPGIGV